MGIRERVLYQSEHLLRMFTEHPDQPITEEIPFTYVVYVAFG